MSDYLPDKNANRNGSNKGSKRSFPDTGRIHKACPGCGSENLVFEVGFITGKYKCNQCGYVGPVIFEFNDREYAKFLKELKENGQ
ncbi:hypothetical protein OXIME_000121 [Oxyplasma meridianum]|uniref:TFIIB-type domain-containing protein n=1 Tax=Oxyplasma meridianum TaxID=3073602 RepID=A0AAX4NFQ4_9ARCH